MRDLKYTTRRPTRQPIKPVGRNRLKAPRKERKPLNIRRHLKRAARVVGGFTLAAVIVLAGYQSYRVLSRIVFFSLKSIEITNNHRLDHREISALAGIKPGDDLLKLSPRLIGEHLEKNPWVESVRVRRYFPDTLAIDVTEREPAAVINVGYLSYLDSKGEVFKPLNEGDNLDFPIVTGITEEELTRDPAGAKAALKRAVELIALLKQGQSFRLEDVSELHYDRGFGFTLFTMQGGIPVKLGTDAYPEKLGRFARIYGDLQTQILSLEYIDLNYSDKIIVKKVLG